MVIPSHFQIVLALVAVAAAEASYGGYSSSYGRGYGGYGGYGRSYGGYGSYGRSYGGYHKRYVRFNSNTNSRNEKISLF
jgi:hypothetical protein